MKNSLIFITIISIIILITILGFIIYISINKDDMMDKESTRTRRVGRSFVDDEDLNNKFNNEKSNIIRKIKQLIIDNNSSPSDSIIDNLDDFISKYELNSIIELPKQFDNWEKDRKKIISLCRFGVQLLTIYEQNKNKVYDKIASFIVETINTKFDSISKFYSTNPSEMKISSWIHVSIDLMRFLVAYEYIGNDETLKILICHDLINKIIPTINHGTKIGFNNIYSLQFAITRLLTNYLYDYDNTFTKDLKFIINEKSISSLTIIVNESNDIKSGVYKDGSCISISHVPNYKYLQRYYNSSYFKFYEEVCKVIVPKVGNLPRIVKKISEKLCHPQSPHVPFGLFDAEGYTVRTNWWDIDGINGTFILPFIGLGVFKTKKFIFSVRVQRPYIAACQLDVNKTGDFILGSIQLRRIYLTHQQYPRKLKWEELINEPGIISIANTRMVPMSFLKESNLKSDSYSCDDIDSNNFIARLSDSGGILFWFNKYKCTLIHSTITEVGVFTNNGLDTYYIIHNHGLNVIQFCIQDKYSPQNFLNFKQRQQLKCSSEPSSVDGFVKFPPAGPTSLSWRMVFDLKKKTNINYDSESRMITFSYKSYSYKILMKDESQYIIERNDGKILAGSSSSLPNHSIEIDGNIFVRSPITLMYSRD